MIYVYIILFLQLLYCIHTLIRNRFVSQERDNMSELIFKENNWKTLLKIKHTVSYNNMMDKFWVYPIHKLWPEELQELRKSK